MRLERDHPGEIRDFYGRYLAYVFAKKNGQWVNYNVECVRAGHSPYFMKYGRSRRFHREFVDAQKEAQEAKRGIWKPGAMHYDDYDERLRWWAEREAAITRFEREQNEHPESHIALTRWDAMLKLEQRLGQEVTAAGRGAGGHSAGERTGGGEAGPHPHPELRHRLLGPRRAAQHRPAVQAGRVRAGARSRTEVPQQPGASMRCRCR